MDDRQSLISLAQSTWASIGDYDLHNWGIEPVSSLCVKAWGTPPRCRKARKHLFLFGTAARADVGRAPQGQFRYGIRAIMRTRSGSDRLAWLCNGQVTRGEQLYRNSRASEFTVLVRY